MAEFPRMHDCCAGPSVISASVSMSSHARCYIKAPSENLAPVGAWRRSASVGAKGCETDTRNRGQKRTTLLNISLGVRGNLSRTYFQTRSCHYQCERSKGFQLMFKDVREGKKKHLPFQSLCSCMCVALCTYPRFPRACVEKPDVCFFFPSLLTFCVALPAGRIVIATTAVTVTVGKKTAIAGGKETTFVCVHKRSPLFAAVASLCTSTLSCETPPSCLKAPCFSSFLASLQWSNKGEKKRLGRRHSSMIDGL